MTEATPPRAASTSSAASSSRAPSPDGAGQGWASLGTLLAGMLVWGGAGFGIDALLGITLFFPVGVLVGLAAAVYLVYVSGAPGS